MPELDAVLPLLPRDLERFSILARSLERHFEDLGRLFIVVPDRFFRARAAEILSVAGALPVEVIPESALVPEMSHFWHLSGWYKQQLIKLAAADLVATDYFLTLDADVVCTRATSAAQLVPGGKSACFVIHEDQHPTWYVGAEAALGLQARRRSVLHNVTPVVWAKAAVQELIAHLDAAAHQRHYAKGMRGARQRLLFDGPLLGRHPQGAPWRAWLAASYPWAEYAMYFTFLEATGRFDRYHFDSAYCIYDIARSVWWKDDFASWEAGPLFEGTGPPYFAVIQSNAHVPAAQVWEKLSPWLGAPSQRMRAV